MQRQNSYSKHRFPFFYCRCKVIVSTVLFFCQFFVHETWWHEQHSNFSKRHRKTLRYLVFEKNQRLGVVSEMPIRLKQQKKSKAQTPPFRGIFLKQIIEFGVFTMEQKFTNLYDAMCNNNTLMYNQR